MGVKLFGIVVFVFTAGGVAAVSIIWAIPRVSLDGARGVASLALTVFGLTISGFLLSTARAIEWKFNLIDRGIHPADLKRYTFADSWEGKLWLGVLAEMALLAIFLAALSAALIGFGYE